MFQLPMTRTRIFIITIILCVVIFIVVFTLFLMRKGNTNQLKSTQSPTSMPISSKNHELSIIEILPSDPSSQMFFPVQEIKITFNAPVNSKNFKYRITPATKTRVMNNTPSSIIVTPETVWTPGTTTITILPATTSIDGESLREGVQYTFQSELPANPPPANSNYPPKEVQDYLRSQQ